MTKTKEEERDLLSLRMQSILSKYTLKEKFKLFIENSKEQWNKARERDSEIIVDLSGCNFAGFNFSEYDLTNVNLSNANLSHAIFVNTIFLKTDLSDALLTNAFIASDLKGVTLKRISQIDSCDISYATSIGEIKIK